MADVTISQLPAGTPSNSASIPFSDGGVTNQVAPGNILANAGKVGIGTLSPKGTLEISSDKIPGETGAQCVLPYYVVIGNGGGGYGTIGYNLDYRSASNNTTGVKYLVGDTISQLDFIAGGFAFRNAPAGTSGSTATLTDRLRIDALGNVGIGTTSPTAKLDVNGNLNVSGTITSPSVAKAWVRFNGPGTSVPANGADVTSLISASYNINKLIFVSQNRWQAYFTTPFTNALRLCGVGSSSANNMAYNLVAGVSFTTTYVEFYTPNGGNVNTSSTLLPTGTTNFVVFSQ